MPLKAALVPNKSPTDPPMTRTSCSSDIISLLRKQSTPDMPLVAIFHSILKGEGTRHQRQAFGHSRADEGRKIIVGVIEDYARRTENHTLLRLLDKIRNPEPRQPPPSKEPKEPPKPKLPPDEQDFLSIVDVLERHGRKVGTAILGKARRSAGWKGRPGDHPRSIQTALPTCWPLWSVVVFSNASRVNRAGMRGRRGKICGASAAGRATKVRTDAHKLHSWQGKHEATAKAVLAT